MAFQKGQSGNPAGRKPGSKNILTKTVKENLVAAFEQMGGLPAFVQWAKKNPKDFYGHYAKMLPLEVSGPDGTGITVVIQKFSESKK
jgi:hypothetical protein